MKYLQGRFKGYQLVITAFALTLAGCDFLGIGGDKPEAGQNPQPAAPSAQTGEAIRPGTPTALPSEVLATVNGVQITKSDLELRINDLKAMVQNAGRAWQPLQPQQMEELLEELVDSELLRQQVLKEGLDKQVNVQRRWLALQRQLFAQEWIAQAQEEVNVDAATVEAFYEQNVNAFTEPERLRLRQIVVGSEEQAKQALSMLYAGNSSFSQLAAQISEGPNSDRGGLLESAVMRDAERAALYPTNAEAQAAGVMSLGPKLEAAAFSISEEGGLSNYVKGPDGKYYVFQLEEREPGRQQPLNEVWDNIEAFLTLQSLQTEVDTIRGSATIERFPNRIEGIAQ